ncbi:TonB-dependent receptor plug domain-containing protein [Rhodoferax aquaticus]|uniref:TonB-dependent receptor n=1 Tax=Rhodoferax aquaticus TaxID=2527691 RepID=A0A515EQA7_9BURK|nr:TonB-dependent receptor [Rhodoferax aquaticus]QDL54864.1 hypothetical protein EXZ61_12185 [Rhodoferax aquaticus]
MQKKLISLMVLWPISMLHAQIASPEVGLGEQEYWAEMPIVLSVSRLAQRLDETPGAVTVLDRNFIRMSGARDVVDVLRLVPGFQTTTSFETDAPMATYHGRTDDWANRIQVLVDGRSVYAGHLQGSAGMGWQTLAIEDIERIEVLRGSNSAAYGARAFLGVVNIVSRDVRELSGPVVYANIGENGIKDTGARLSWGQGSEAQRLSVDKRGDYGLRGAYGANQIDRVNYAAHLMLGGGNELLFRAGALDINAGRGVVGDIEGNSAHMRYLGSRYIQADIRNSLGEDHDVLLSASHTEHSVVDSFPYQTPGPYFGAGISANSSEYNDAISLQDTRQHTDFFRTVWGVEARRERLASTSSFDTVGQVSTDFIRLFGNTELRLSKDWILNAGAMAERSSIAGFTLAPRLMLNWHLTERQTWRMGLSTAYRPPSAYENYAATRYYDVNGGNPTQYYVKSNGGLRPERVESRELGYLVNVPELGMTGDVRVFKERIVDGIAHNNASPQDYLNSEDFEINGLEHQVAWKPANATRVFFSQTWTDIKATRSIDDATAFRTNQSAPKYAASLAFMHTFKTGTSVTLMHQRAEETALMASNRELFSVGRTDLRLAHRMKLEGHGTEFALTLQNADVPYRDGNRKFFFDQRLFVSVRYEH